jgi:hypothetical protein
MNSIALNLSEQINSGIPIDIGKFANASLSSVGTRLMRHAKHIDAPQFGDIPTLRKGRAILSS